MDKQDERVKQISNSIFGNPFQKPVADPPAADPPAVDPPAVDPPAVDPPAVDPPAEVNPVKKTIADAILAKPGADVSLDDKKTVSEINGIIKQKYGKETLGDLFGEYEKLSTDIQQLQEVKTKYDGVVANLAVLPEEVLYVIEKAGVEGADPIQAMREISAADYTKDPSAVSEKELLKMFYPDQFSDEDFEDDDQKDKIKIAVNHARDKYAAAYKDRKDKISLSLTRAKQREDLVSKSIETAFSSLSSSEFFANVPSTFVQEARKEVADGGIENAIYNPDGSYKKTAAEVYMMLKHGPEIIRKAIEIASGTAIQKEREQVVVKGADALQARGGGLSGEKDESVVKVKKTTERVFGPERGSGVKSKIKVIKD